MKKGFMITAGGCVLALFCFVFASLVVTGLQGKETVSTQAAEQRRAALAVEQIPETWPTPLYLVREYAGCVAVFMRPDYDNPVSVTDIMAVTLRRSDRECLKAGIPVENEEELAHLLEDYAP